MFAEGKDRKDGKKLRGTILSQQYRASVFAHRKGDADIRSIPGVLVLGRGRPR